MMSLRRGAAMMEFGAYRLDPDEERVWKGQKLLSLRRKPFAILRYLVANPKRVVTHDELLEHVWAGATVSESAVRSHLHELRQVLGDGVIETVIGRGYRFVAELTVPRVEKHAPAGPRRERLVVGRDAELAVLRAAFERVETGHRQVCFVTGDPGIGKTTLVDTFLDELEDRGVLAVRGQCVEQFGTPEAYLAIIEVVSRLRRVERGEQILAGFARYAPTFLAKMPTLVPEGLEAEVERRAQGGSEARMLRELAEAIDNACATEPLVIVLEDLQWSDLASLDLFGVLGQRVDRAKLMIIATARRAALNTTEHPLGRVVKSLVARSGATHLAIGEIERSSVAELLARRFGTHALPDELVDVLALITGGTPLFLVTLVDDLVRRRMIVLSDDRWQLAVKVDEVAAHRPDSITQLIDIQLDRLTADEQRLLEAASLVGAVFSTTTVAAALGTSVEHVDDLCDSLVRRGLFLKRAASEETPDGAVHSAYAVTHALVQEVNEQRGAPARRQRWHRAIAEYLETAYAGHRESIAPSVASHFDKAALPARAFDYYVIAGDQSARRFASRDALSSYERACELLARLPHTRERDVRELKVLGTISQLMIRMPFSDHPIHVYQRTIDLARAVGDAANLVAGLSNLCIRHLTRAEYDLAVGVCDEIRALIAANTLDQQVLEYGLNVLALTAAYRGQLATALGLFEQIASSSDRGEHQGVIHSSALHGPRVRGAIARAYVAVARCLLGAPDRALREGREACATDLEDPISVGIIESMLVRVHLLRRDPPAMVEAANRVVLQRGTAGRFIMEEARIVGRWVEHHQKPVSAADARAMIDSVTARLSSVSLGATIVAVPLAEMLVASGLVAEAREVIDRSVAYARTRQELLYEPDLVRMRGDLLVESDPESAAVAYREAYESAVSMDIWLFAVRAAVRLARLHPDEGRPLVATAVARCAEQPDLPDFAEARSVLGTAGQLR